MDRTELIARLRAMVSDDGRAIVCAGRTSREMAADIEAAAAALESRPEEWESVRSMDESGSPESVGCIAQKWIDERAQEVSRLFGPERCEITQEPAKALILSVDRKPWYVATTWRDPMNFAQLVRWMATGGNPAVTAIATDTTPSRGEPTEDEIVGIINLVTELDELDALDKAVPEVQRHVEAIIARLSAPSRDEEGSIDREAIARLGLAWSAIMRKFGHAFGDIDNGYYPEVDEMRGALAALKASTPETQTVEGGGQ